jgi:hypothetical protein
MNVMRVRVLFKRRNVIVFPKPLMALLAGAALLFSCERASEEAPSPLPPPTHPLIRDFIGYGVVNTSFTHIMDEPGQEGLSRGYFRKGALVKIIERRAVASRGNIEFWVFIDGTNQGTSEPDTSEPGPGGWLNESAVDIYDNKAKALTASESMIR